MKNYDVVVNYKGAFNLDVVDSILLDLKDYINQKVDDRIIGKRIYTLSVECLENIYRHSDIDNDKDGLAVNYPSRFLVERISDNFMIHTGNLILRENIDDVIQRIEKLNLLDPKGVNKLYKESLTNAEISEKGGAGLGLIVMAKMTGQKIRFDFEKITNKFSYFAMQLHLKKGE